MTEYSTGPERIGFDACLLLAAMFGGTSCAGTRVPSQAVDAASGVEGSRRAASSQVVVPYLARDPGRQLPASRDGPRALEAARTTCASPADPRYASPTNQQIVAAALRYFISNVLQGARPMYYVSLSREFEIDSISLDAMCDPPAWLLNVTGRDGPRLEPLSSRRDEVLFLYVSKLELAENSMAQVELGYYANIDAANRVRLFLKNSDGEWIVERNENIWISRQQDEPRRPSASGNCLVDVELPQVFAGRGAMRTPRWDATAGGMQRTRPRPIRPRTLTTMFGPRPTSRGSAT